MVEPTVGRSDLLTYRLRYLQLVILQRARWTISAIARTHAGTPLCDVTAALAAYEATRDTRASARGILKLVQRSAQNQFGPRSLGTDLFHCVDSQNDVWEFIKGRLRLLCFFAEERNLVICTHIFLKQSRTTPRAEIARVARHRSDYFAASRAGLIELLEDE
jgi:phage-related protein